jgi:hypothetical protein
MNAFTTTECMNCRHTFLRYASSCPECGWLRPKQRKVNKPMIASLIASAAFLGLTLTMLVKYKRPDLATHADTQRSTTTH